MHASNTSQHLRPRATSSSLTKSSRVNLERWEISEAASDMTHDT